MTYIKIADKVYSADDPHLSEALATVYGSPTHPRCLCCEGGVEMTVTKRGPKYVVRAVRRTGSLHSFECEFYEPPF
ncbi:DUF1173 family protein [Burkholderia stagnalis]|uniref:DUF1173 family protein n=1 Tax=Burkholderia stagnalis TaxID=1503054 RepID=UPI000F5A3DF7|nr:DUF1173 family protein [Burkholderia stagnalis]RQQ88696.1 DUF1173 family protein [Burkholderia stagnalis]